MGTRPRFLAAWTAAKIFMTQTILWEKLKIRLAVP